MIVPDLVGNHATRRPADEFAVAYAEKWETEVLVLDWKRGRFRVVIPR